MSRDSGGDVRISRSTLATQVEQAIRGDIIFGTLEPGLRLRGSDLAKRYGVSATPLREALQRLAEQKLIELDPRMGATVAPVSRSELEDTYEQRELLECIALERSITHGGDAWRRNLDRTYRDLEEWAAKGDPDAWAETPSPAASLQWTAAHRAFHDALLEACDSPWLLHFVRMLSDHSERYRTLIRLRAHRKSLEEHRDIYAAAIALDATAAKEALRRHLAITVDVLEQLLPLDTSDEGREGAGSALAPASSAPSAEG